jgi:hypothetical protein
MRFFKLLIVSGFLLGAPALASEPPRAKTESAKDQLHFHVGHAYSPVDAHARLQLLFEYWKGRFGVEAKWNGDEARISGRIWGIQIVGAIRVGKNAVTADANDPGSLMRGTAYAYIDKKLKKYLHPTFKEE